MKDENLFSLMFGLNFRVSQEALCPSLPPSLPLFTPPQQNHIYKSYQSNVETFLLVIAEATM